MEHGGRRAGAAAGDRVRRKRCVGAPEKDSMLTGRQGIYFFDTGRIFRMDRERGEEIREFLLYMDRYGKSGLYIAASELPAFVRDMLPVLSVIFR